METVNIIIEMEDGGVMKGELYPEIAPISVENFLKLIDQDFFAGLIFLSLIHISEPTRQAEISYAVFCLKKKNAETGIKDYMFS